MQVKNHKCLEIFLKMPRALHDGMFSYFSPRLFHPAMLDAHIWGYFLEQGNTRVQSDQLQEIGTLRRRR